MTPQVTEQYIRKRARALKLTKKLNEYDYDTVETEIMHNCFGKLLELHPEDVKAIVDGDLDFYLSEVED